MDLASSIVQQQSDGSPLRIRQGVITQITPTLLVQIGSAATPTPASVLDGYVPAVDHVVSVLEQGADRLVIGPVSTPSQSFTPSWRNLSVGNGVAVGRWRLLPGGLVGVNYELTIGTTTSITGSVGVAAPAGAPAPARVSSLSATYEDSGSRYYIGSAVNIATLTRFELMHSESGNQGQVNSTAPFTWAAGDDIVISGCFFT